MPKKSNAYISLPEAAVRLRLTWAQAYQALTRGELGPPEKRKSRWVVSAEGVRKYQERLEAEMVAT